MDLILLNSRFFININLLVPFWIYTCVHTYLILLNSRSPSPSIDWSNFGLISVDNVSLEDTVCSQSREGWGVTTAKWPHIRGGGEGGESEEGVDCYWYWYLSKTTTISKDDAMMTCRRLSEGLHTGAVGEAHLILK